MAYIEGFVVPVPAANKEAYRKHAVDNAPIFKEFGVVRVVEAWGDAVPDGKVTDFKGAVQAKPDEVVVFAWFEYPSKSVRDDAVARMTADPRMKSMSTNLPFDAMRMIYAGFDALVDEGTRGTAAYVDATLIPVATADKEAVRAWAKKMAALFREYGATRVIDAWGDDVPDGKVTDYKRAVKAKDGETVLYGWVEWASKESRDKAWEKMMADPRMQPGGEKPPFDGQRMVYGGFVPLIDA